MRLNGIDYNKSVYNVERFHPYLQIKQVKTGGDLHINSLGFRNDEITEQKPPDTYRIVILGGSTAFGDWVSYENNSAKLLQDLLNKHYSKHIEVLNAAVSGYNSEQSIIDYTFRITDFKPDMVIMWHGINDMYKSCPDSQDTSRTYKPDYSHGAYPMLNIISEYYFPPLIKMHFVTLDYAFHILQQYMYTDIVNYVFNTFKAQREARTPAVDMDFPSINSYRRNLEHFIAIVRSDHAQLILGNQPNMDSTAEKYKRKMGYLVCYNGHSYASQRSRTKAITAFNATTKAVSTKYNVPFIDIDSFIPRTPDYFFDEVHFNDKGHTIVADQLYTFIVKQALIPE